MHALMGKIVPAVDMLEEPLPDDEEEQAPEANKGKKKRRRNP